MRRPCVIKVDDLLDSVANKNPDHWDMLANNERIWKQQTRSLSDNKVLA
jgi:hypothetical protein